MFIHRVFTYQYQSLKNIHFIVYPINPNRSLEIFSCKKSDYSRRCHHYSICILTQYVSFIQFRDKMKAKFSNDRFGLKEVPSFLLCTILWYWIRRIWYSRHVRQFIFILILCSWALSIGLTLFLARDNAGLLRNRRENSFIKHQSQNLKTDEIRILWTNEAQFYPWRKKCLK